MKHVVQTHNNPYIKQHYYRELIEFQDLPSNNARHTLMQVNAIKLNTSSALP